MVKKLFKNETFVSHFAVGEDTDCGDPPWSVSPTDQLFRYNEIISIILNSF